MIDKQKIQKLFKKYNIEWFVNIIINKTKKLEYGAFLDELWVSENIWITTKMTIFKDNRKSSLSMDWFNLEKLEELLKKSLRFIDYSEVDENNVMPQITDSAEKDFRNLEINNLDFDYFTTQFENLKKYNFNSQVRFEDFSFATNEVEHYYINSLWSYKLQKDNSNNVMVNLVWQNWEVQDEEYLYRVSKDILSLDDEIIKEYEDILLDKINPKTDLIKSWEYTVTLDRDVVENFISLLLGSFNAEAIRENISLLSQYNLWERIFSDKISLISTPKLENSIWNSLFDAEWVTLKENILISSWVYNSKFYNYKNALIEGWSNAENNDKLWLSTACDIVIEAEKTPDFLEKSKFLFTNLMAFHTVDSNTWKFALAWEWYFIEDGKKVAYLKNISLAGNIKDVFSNIEAIWNDDDKYSNIHACSITINNAQIIA